MRNDQRYRPQPRSQQVQIAQLGLEGEQDVNDAREWISRNVTAYSFMVDNAHRLVARRGWVSANYLVNMVRNELCVSVRNGLAPAFSRIMEQQYPDLQGKFRQHSSRSDGYV